MRCPSCGTENAPDSRFCGGCGARLGATAQRVAPTQKISDDASFPQQRPTSGGAGGAQVAVQPSVASRPVPPPHYAVNPPGIAPPSAPPPRAISSAPPAVYAPLASSPPNGAATPPRPRVQLDDPSMSMPMVARRPWGLILIVLLIDVGLAVAGGWMLSQGLGERAATAPRSSASMTPPSTVATGATPSTEPPSAASPSSATASADPTIAATPNAVSPGPVTPNTATPAPETGAAAPANDPAPAPVPANDARSKPKTTPKPRPKHDPAPANDLEPTPGVTAGGSPIEISISSGHDATATGSAGKRPRRRHGGANKAGGTTSGPIDPYDTPAPGPDPLPLESR